MIDARITRIGGVIIVAGDDSYDSHRSRGYTERRHPDPKEHTDVSDQPLLSRLDLNLLVALDALLTEQSVTRAAERLHLSQPALSASLARLRTHFNDPILARRGNTYELTPLAFRLIEHTTTALEAARRVFESQATWNPRDSTREFSVYGSDYGFATIGTAVSKLAAERAPGVRFRFMLHNPSIVDEVSTRLRAGRRDADPPRLPHGSAVRGSVARRLGDRRVRVERGDRRRDHDGAPRGRCPGSSPSSPARRSPRLRDSCSSSASSRASKSSWRASCRFRTSSAERTGSA